MDAIPDLKITDTVTGEVRLVELDAPIARYAEPGAVYSFADERGYNTAVDGLEVSRRGPALVMTIDGATVVHIDGFFADGAAARFRVVDEREPSGLWTVDSREADGIADEDDDGAVTALWPLQNAPATVAVEKEVAEALVDGAPPGGADAGAAASGDDARDGGGDADGLSTAAKVGIGAGVGLGAIAAIGAGSGGDDAPAGPRSDPPTIGDGSPRASYAAQPGVRTVADLDADEPVSWAIVAGELDADAFGIDADGVLGFLAAPRIDPGAEATEVYSVNVRATDADGEVAEQRVVVLLYERSDFGDELDGFGPGTDPAAEGAAPVTLAVRENAANVPLAGSIFEFDDDFPYEVAIAGGEDAARFATDGRGTLAFVDAPDFEAPLDADGDNVYELRLTDPGGRVRDVRVVVEDAIESGPPSDDDVLSGAPDLAVPIAVVEPWWGELH